LYKNPLNVVGCVATTADGRIVLCRRAIQPRKGCWTLPAGFMEVGESVEEGALREAAEEADIKASSRGLLAMYSIPKGGQVHIFVRATVDETHVASSACTLGDVHHSPTFYGCGPESLETRAFAPADIPWEDLAFPTVRDAIVFYLREPHSTSVDVKTITEPLPPPGAKLAPPELR